MPETIESKLNSIPNMLISFSAPFIKRPIGEYSKTLFIILKILDTNPSPSPPKKLLTLLKRFSNMFGINITIFSNVFKTDLNVKFEKNVLISSNNFPIMLGTNIIIFFIVSKSSKFLK